MHLRQRIKSERRRRLEKRREESEGVSPDNRDIPNMHKQEVQENMDKKQYRDYTEEFESKRTYKNRRTGRISKCNYK